MAQLAALATGLAAGAAISGAGKKPSTPAGVTEAQQRAEALAEAQTREEAAQIAARNRARRTGGLRLLMAPGRLGTNTRLGSQGDTFGVKMD